MTVSLDTSDARWTTTLAVIFAGILITLQLVAVSLLYQHNFEFTCRAVAADGLCAFTSQIVPRTLGVLAAFGLFALVLRDDIRQVFSQPGPLWTGLVVNVVGFAAALAPWFFLSDASAPVAVTTAMVAWLGGAGFAALGLGLVLAPAAAWATLAKRRSGALAAVVVGGLILPDLALALQPIWRIEWITNVTFHAVLWLLGLVGYTLVSDGPTKLIGIIDADPDQSFYVLVGPQCSGVEGFALITLFASAYLFLFRRDLAFPRALLLFPIGIALSWSFNVLRISVLLSLGYEVSPELAIGGFHSHAGWLAFILLSIGMIFAVQHIAFFRKAQAPRSSITVGSSLWNDPIAARILPFIVFMLSGLLASTFSETPGVVYPLRAAAMAIALALFWRIVRDLPWRLDPISGAAGLVVGVLWIVTSPPADGPPPFGELAGLLFVIWIVARMIGTSVLVPIIEEMLFRGYLLERLAPTGKGVRMLVAIAISAILFGALHDRWLAAGLAGLVFGALVYRSGNMTDAIFSHATANASIAIWALATGAWHII